MDRFQNRNEQQWSILRSLEAGVSLLFRDFFIPQILETNLPPPPPFPPIKKKSTCLRKYYIRLVVPAGDVLSHRLLSTLKTNMFIISNSI